MSKVNREELLKQLESVLPGLSLREIVEQSTCFIFKEGVLWTFNEEICCRHATMIDFEGAVQSAPLLALLRKMPEEIIDISKNNEGQFYIRGKRRRAGIHMENEVLLPVESVETPEKWKKLPADFLDGLELVESCAGKNEQDFATTCIHFTADYMEAMDNFQIARFVTPTKMKKEALIRRDSIKHIIQLGVTHLCRTKTWLHFKNPSGLVISCRLYKDDFQQLDEWLQIKGKKVTLPKAIAPAAERAEIFASENAENNFVTVTLDRDSVVIAGAGPSGWVEEKKKVKYDGKPFSFGIAPKLLVQLVKNNEVARVNKSALMVKHGKLLYTTHLRKA